jgi:hypothetical protein
MLAITPKQIPDLSLRHVGITAAESLQADLRALCLDGRQQLVAPLYARTLQRATPPLGLKVAVSVALLPVPDRPGGDPQCLGDGVLPPAFDDGETHVLERLLLRRSFCFPPAGLVQVPSAIEPSLRSVLTLQARFVHATGGLSSVRIHRFWARDFVFFSAAFSFSLRLSSAW